MAKQTQFTVIQGGAGTAGIGGTGPEDPTMEQRVSKLEEQFGRFETKIDRVELKLAELVGLLSQIPKSSDYAALKAEVSELKGKVSNLPSTLTLFSAMIATWVTGAGIVFTLLKYAGK